MCPIPLRGQIRKILDRPDPEDGNNHVNETEGHFPSRLHGLTFIFADQMNDHEHYNFFEALRIERHIEQIRHQIRRRFLERLARNWVTRQQDWYVPRVFGQHLPLPPPRRQQQFDARQRRHIVRMFRRQNEHNEMYLEFEQIINFNVQIFAD